MRPIIQTVAAGSSLVVPLDIYENPGQVYIDVIIASGAPTVEVQGSNDDPFSGVAPANFLTTPLIAAATSPPTQATITGPIPRQLYCSVAGTGAATFRITQMGIRGG